MVEESRKKILEGLHELQQACNRIAPEFCHEKCPYEDICLMLRCVGYSTGLKIQPCDWRLEDII